MEEYFPHVPGAEEILRVGKAWHGLVEFVGYYGTWCFMDTIMLTTRSGKRIPYPSSAGLSDERVLVPLFAPRAILYMRDGAELEDENEDGTDWSEYVIVQSGGDFSDLFQICGLYKASLCFFTPDDGGRAVPLEFEGGGTTVHVYNPLKVGGQLTRIDSIQTGFNDAVRRYVLGGITKSGRSAFFTSGLSPGRILIGNTGVFQGPVLLGRLDISGGVSDGVSSVAVSATDIPVGEAVFAGNSESEQMYAHYMGDGQIVYRDYPMGSSGPLSGWGVADGWSHLFHTRNAPSFFYVDGNGYGIVHGNLVYETSSDTNAEYTTDTHGGGGDYDIVNGVKEVDLSGSMTLAYAANAVEVGSIKLSYVMSTKGTSKAFFPNLWHLRAYWEYEEDWSGSISVTMDSVEVLNLNGYLWYDDLLVDPTTYINWFSGAKTPSGTVAKRVRATERDGDGLLQVSIYTNPYKSADIFSIGVLVQRGRQDPTASYNYADPATITQEFYIGKCFAGGVVFDDPIVLSDDDFDRDIFRAFDPLTKTITRVYDYPVFFQ